MTDSIRPDTLREPADAAAYWWMRAQSGSMSEAEQQQLQAWLQADPSHAREYRRAQGIWNAMALVPAERLRALAQPEPAAAPTPSPAPVPASALAPASTPAASPQTAAPPAPAGVSTRRWWLAGCGSAATAAIATSLVLPGLWSDPVQYQAQWATQAGERQTHTLPDGSSIALNVASTLSVRYTASKRDLQLAAGEAVFTVQPDAKRPFTVTLGDVQVRVTGTRFAVRREAAQPGEGPERVQVLVESGSVELRHGKGRSATVRSLGPGDWARHEGRGPWRIRQGSDIDAALAWRQGRVVFRDTPLADAITELNRYAPRPIRLANASLGRLRIAGVFSADDTAAFLQLLPDIVGSVKVRREPDGSATIVPR